MFQYYTNIAKKMVQSRRLRLVVTLGTLHLDAPSTAVQVVLLTA